MAERRRNPGQAAHSAPPMAGQGEASAPTRPAASSAEAANDPADDAIVEQVRGGDTDAFAGLMRRHGRRVQSVVARHVPGEHVEEVVQDAFVQAYQSLAGYRVGTSFARWMATIALRTCYDFWRAHYRRAGRVQVSLDQAHQAWIDRAAEARDVAAFQAEIDQREAREVLEYVLGRLSPEDRLVVSLVHLEGLSVREAAGELGWSTVNVKVRAHRARRRLRRELESLLQLPRSEP